MIQLICSIITCSSYSIKAETTPRWVSKGVDELNKERSNQSYSFQVFHLQDEKKTNFDFNPLSPLTDYVCKKFDVPEENLEIVEEGSGSGFPTYMISFNQKGKPTVVYARVVDYFNKFDDYPDGSTNYNIWQLYAISDPDVLPEFDEFVKKDRYNGTPLAMSIIPGLGQIYKGQKAKGYSILGVEAAMVASIIYSTTQVHKWNNQASKHPEFYDNYRSKATTFKQWRAFCLVAGGGLYVYNLLDAALSKGARYIQIKRKSEHSGQIMVMPFFTTESAGVGMAIRF